MPILSGRIASGLTASQLPVEGAESYSDYLLGTRDGIPKTPNGQNHHRVPAATIAAHLPAVRGVKPAVLFKATHAARARMASRLCVQAVCLPPSLATWNPAAGPSGLGLQAEDGGPVETGISAGRTPVRAEHPGLSLD